MSDSSMSPGGEDDFVMVPCFFPPWFAVNQNSSGPISRIYNGVNGISTVLTAVPTLPPSEKRSNACSWDRNPETFSHPLLRRYLAPQD